MKESDLNQIKKLAAFLNINESVIKYRPSTHSYRLVFNNEQSIKKVMEKFNIHYTKTYEPCDFKTYESLSNDELTALLIGIIDGDGNISTDGKYITITAYKT